MYNQDLVAEKDAKITVTSSGRTTTVDLYSKEGFELVSSLWVKAAVEFRTQYEPSWLGVPIIQFSETVVMMQELIWRLRPDVIIECGLAHGGSAIFYASICELVGNGRIIGVDVEVRKYNRVALNAHPLGQRIYIIEGSSIDQGTFDEVRSRCSAAKTVLAILDSNHSTDHVAAELRLYSQLVTPGSYLVAMDGSQAHVWDTPNGKPEWKTSNPLIAIREFVATNPDFEIDEHYTRNHITNSPEGFLRKVS